MKSRYLACMVLGVQSLAFAAGPAEKSLADQYFSGKNPRLTQKEKDALSISQQWQKGGPGTKPVPGGDGTIRFLYGVQQPSIVCAVLQVCDVELQAGEQVNSIHLGDSARWLVEPAVTGSGPGEIQHLVIKPMDVALETSLIVTTDRRTYHFRLRSHRTEFMARVAFTYGDESAARWGALRQRDTRQKQERTIPETREYLDDLDFSYAITGSASWKPVRVYNDGNKTILQMARAISQTEAPTLLVVRKDGGWFSDQETVLVNYRVQGDRYVVDSVFDKAILVAGVGNAQQRVTIEREK